MDTLLNFSLDMKFLRPAHQPAICLRRSLAVIPIHFVLAASVAVFCLAWSVPAASAQAAASPNTMTLCGNPYYCIYDVPTYSSPLAAEQAFVKAVGSSPLGQDNFSEYPVGHLVVYSDYSGGYVCDASGDCGIGMQSNPGIPNGAGNYLTDGVVGYGLYYVGFDYAVQENGTSYPFTFASSQGPLAGPYTEPAKGFFGVIASSTLSNIGTPALTAFDNFLWAGGPGIGPDNPLWPDTTEGGGTGGGCGTGKVCWFWPALGAFYGITWLDPSGASAYTYSTLDGSNFTSIGGFPSGFAAPFDVSSGNTDFGLFEPTQTLRFPGGGVPSFTISGITPGTDPSSPAAFPIGVTLNSLLASVEAIPSEIFVPPSQITVTTSSLSYNQGTGTAAGTITLMNVSSESISGPFQILFTALMNGVTLVNAAGMYGSISYLAPSSVSDLAPGQSTSVNFEFSESSSTAISFVPVVYAGSGESQLPPGQLSVPSLITVPAVPVGGAETALVTVKNIGTGPLTFNVSIIGPNYSVLTNAQNTCTAELGAGQTCILPVAFHPPGVGLHTVPLIFTPSSGSPVVADLRGLATGVGDFSESSLDFGSIPVGTSKVLSVTFTNFGVSGSPTFTATFNNVNYSLAPGGTCGAQSLSSGQSCTLNVQFAPAKAIGVHNAGMAVTPTAGPSTIVKLLGTATAP